MATVLPHTCVRGRRTAAHRRGVHHVVVVERGEVGQLDDDGGLEDLGPAGSPRCAGEQREHRPHPLAAGQRRGAGTRRRRAGRPGATAVAQALLDRGQPGPDGVVQACVGAGAGRARPSPGVASTGVDGRSRLLAAVSRRRPPSVTAGTPRRPAAGSSSTDGHDAEEHGDDGGDARSRTRWRRPGTATTVVGPGRLAEVHEHDDPHVEERRDRAGQHADQGEHPAAAARPPPRTRRTCPMKPLVSGIRRRPAGTG